MLMERMFKMYDKIDSLFEWKAPRPMFRALKQELTNDLIGVEIGTQRGTNAVNILKYLSMKKLYLIDPYEFYEYEGRSPNAVDPSDVQDENFQEAKRVLKNYGDKIQFIFKKSEDAVDDIPNDLDFVYVDGNHDYPYVKRDIELYFPKLKTAGFMGGHDINMHGVFQAVSEFRSNGNKKINIKRKDWWFIK